MGFVYIIHLEEKLAHAQHYIGYAEKSVEARIKHHRNGTGSKFMTAVNKAGIKWSIVRIYENVDRAFERRLKNQKKSKKLCPICRNFH